MDDSAKIALEGLDEDAALRSIVEGTATETGERFFTALVDALARALDTQGAWVTEYLPSEDRLRAIAFRMGDQWIEGYEYDLPGTPCEVVIREKRLVHVPENVVALYPTDEDLSTFDAVSFLAVPCLDADGAVLGHLAVIDTRPMSEEPRYRALIRIFAARAGAELRRMRAEAAVREREVQLRRLIDGAMDAIVELDQGGRVTLWNPAAERVFRLGREAALGIEVGSLLAAESREAFARVLGELDAALDDGGAVWLPGSLTGLRRDGTGPFDVEATVSRARRDGRTWYTLILRDVSERRESEARIRSLTHEAEALRAEIREVRGSGEILGRSAALERVLEDIARVGPTDATVLIHGETGTGKELIARAIHAASTRRERPLVSVNCAAIPASLIESEFFGHERGAFTGATARREGRFALADGGTLFLDEVGELPLELQAKLLRVLQDGTFEPLGGARTRRVDVRVVAATNRDLEACVRAGAFREDLYYRLAVFPIALPPLRERKEDVPILAEAFAARLARRMGRPEPRPLPPVIRDRLVAYDWPGNVRELHNVIERALITSRGGALDLDRALPAPAGSPLNAAARLVENERILTSSELQDLERENLRRALEAAGWKVSGEGGAAERLGMPASTLASRMKALGLARRT